ncbi:MAG: hypothetical protein H6840_02170 [Planctomycetes bacterium]|nr:hypothetical protein [Planctomycetota bacterium]
MLRFIRTLHSIIWLFFVGVIAAVPVLGWLGHFRWAAVAAAVVCMEGLVLVANRGRCPLTDLAARYTDDRRANFDIYLPEWLARHNKRIFTVLFVLGCLFAAVLWVNERRPV